MRALSSCTSKAGVRCISGVAPVIYFPPAKPKTSREEQVSRNTNIAIELIRKFKGAPPAAYTRKHTATFDVIEKEIEQLLAGAEKMRRVVPDDAPMDKLTIMERCLRHAVWQYLKDEGRYNFDQMEKWLVYTPLDETRLQQLRRDADLKEKYAVAKKKRVDAGQPDTPMPTFDWAQEYANAVDREIVAEKRFRYDSIAVNTTDRNDAKIDEVLAEYRKPVQSKRLDDLIDLLERFKPVLAREAIMQRLCVKHLEGQLSVWKYMDWNPEVRDRAELEADTYCHTWWLDTEDKRMKAIRMRSKNEIKEAMEKRQTAAIAEAEASGAKKAVGSADAAAREKLLREIINLQSRIGKKEDGPVVEEGKDKKADKRADNLDVYKVDEAKVSSVGLIGLDFIGSEKAKAQN